jgi:transcriptional antiterminator RfaH
MLLTPSELASQQPLDWWFCLKTQPKREHIAAACLRQNCAVEVFSPRIRFQKNTSRGPVWFIESMFPGYLFARFDYMSLHRRVRQGPAIKGFVQFGDRVSLLNNELIAELKSRLDQDGIVQVKQELEPGQNVQIARGPFQGLDALVTRLLAARDRVEILIEWMGRSLQAEAKASDLVCL